MSFKMLYADPNEVDYAVILTRVPELLIQIREQYKVRDFARAIEISYEIGKLYAPSDDNAASRIAFLVQLTAGALYWGGANDEIDKQNEERMRKLERMQEKNRTLRETYEPPF